MNRKSIAALAVAAVMTLGVGASSYAWFTSQATSVNNTVQTGTLLIGGTNGSTTLETFTLNNLYPGIHGSKSKTITIKNNGSINLRYNVSSKFKGQAENLYNKALVKVTNVTSGAVVYNGDLSKLRSALVNSTLSVGGIEEINFEVSLPNNTNNDYQGKTAYVDFVFDAIQNDNIEWIGTAIANTGTGTIGAGSINLTGDPYSYNFSNTGSWSGNYFTETDVYLDPAMTVNTGFEYSVAMGKIDGSHLQDFVFHVARVGNEIKVSADNNAYNNNYINPTTNATITKAGWYTFQHRFYKDGDHLAAELSIIDADKKVVFTETRINETAKTFGVPKYSWFVFINAPEGVNVKNHRDYVTQ